MLITSLFPEYQFEEMDDLFGLIKKDPLAYLHCIRNYGSEILLGRKSLSASLLRTRYAFNKIKQAVEKRFAGRPLAFTFQAQSLFDASLPGIPHFLYTDHTHLENLRYPGFDRNDLFSPEWIACEKIVYQNASMNFTRSTNITRSIIQDYSVDSTRVACVYCGTNIVPDQQGSYPPERYDTKNILFVGGDWLRKGGPVLLEAFQAVLQAHPTARLTIVGCQPDVRHPNITVTGSLPASDLAPYYKRASIFCLPTELEPFGVAFLEAMAFKLPVVATRIGAIPDFIHEGRNGCLVEVRDPQTLAARLNQLLSSPGQCRQFAQYGYELFENTYNWEHTGRLMKEHILRFVA